MTWGEFKRAVDFYVKDDEPLRWIDWASDYYDGPNAIKVKHHEPDGAVSIE